MSKKVSQAEAAYLPQYYKNFSGALYNFFVNECPQLGGELTRKALVQSILIMVNNFYPETTHLRPGQLMWTTIHRDEKPCYGKKISESKITPVNLQLIRSEDILDRAKGKKLRDLKKEALARIFTEAYEQEGCLTNAEAAILLKISPSTVSKYTKEWENENKKLLPRRGTIHDIGPTLTHKKQIIHKLFIEGRTIEEVSRATYHTIAAVHRYITTFKKIFLCRKKQLTNEEIVYTLRISNRLVEEYQNIIDEYALNYEKVNDILLDCNEVSHV
jgi:DNA-binding CsgD family transcriptional regulator